MFTGLVTAIGTVKRVRRTPRILTLTIRSPFRKLVVGESIAVDGVCLTVVTRGRGTFTVQVVDASVRRTSLGDYAAGRRVNLERALRLGDRLGGHLVAGHVDGVGEVVAAREAGDALELDIRLPREVAAVTVPRGSLAIDGVSMTVAALPKRGVARVAVVPHTRQATTLGGAHPGTRVHLEADMVGKMVAQLVAPHRAARVEK